MRPRYIASTKLAFGVVAAIFALQVYQAATQPIRTGEAYIYDRFVRPTARQVLAQELPERDVLYSLIEKRSVGLFHVSPFSVRLPSLLFAILYLWSAWQLARLLLGAGRLFLIAVVVASLIPLQWDSFIRADGIGAALASELCAVWLTLNYWMSNQRVSPLNINLAGAFLGLSVAARQDFAIPATVLGLLFLVAFAMRRRFGDWTNRVLIPAVVTALIFLVLPLSHAHAAAENTPELTAREALRLQTLLSELRARAGSDPIRIGAIRSAEPIINFYRVQHRQTTWSRAERDFSSAPFDYYVLSTADAGWAGERHLIVLDRDADFLLASQIHAAM